MLSERAARLLWAAIRELWRTPGATLIRLVVLTLGLACFLGACSIVAYWNSAEGMFQKSDRTYVLTTRTQIANGFDSGSNPTFRAGNAERLRLSFPEFETVARARTAGEMPIAAGATRARLHAAYADPQLLEIFNLRVVAGSVSTALVQPLSAMVTESAARKLFGSESALGRTIRIGGMADLTVTAVFADVRQPSHLGQSAGSLLRFDVLASWDAGDRALQALSPASKGYQGESLTYVLLREGYEGETVTLIPRLQHFSDVPPGNSLVTRTYGMTPIREVLASQRDAALLAGLNSSISLSAFLLILGAIVLVVACINYVNLSIALVNRRAKEVGLRKIVGARGLQLAFHHLAGTAVLVAIATAIAAMVLATVAPLIRESIGADIGIVLQLGAEFWMSMAGLLVACVVLTGGYPAILLARMRPDRALRAEGNRTKSLVPTLLVALQFFAASFLLIVVIVMRQQEFYLRTSSLSEGNDPLIVVTNQQSLTRTDFATFRNELKRTSGVTAVAGMSDFPWVNESRNSYLKASAGANLTGFQLVPADASSLHMVASLGVDHDFFSTIGTRVVAGRVFDRDRLDTSIWKALDKVNPASLVVDEAFVRLFGFQSPQAAVGQLVYLQVDDERQPVRIIGVVASRPLYFTGDGTDSTAYYIDTAPSRILIRVAGGNVRGTIDAVSRVWEKVAPNDMFRYEFEDQLFARGYELFGQARAAFACLALIACLISVAGLIGMAGHMTRRRRREIGVRKTLGATTRRVLMQLLGEFSVPVVIASLASWPLAYLAARAYLNLFIQRAPLTPMPFITTLAISLAIACAAVALQSYRAARIRPAVVLRAE